VNPTVQILHLGVRDVMIDRKFGEKMKIVSVRNPTSNGRSLYER